MREGRRGILVPLRLGQKVLSQYFWLVQTPVAGGKVVFCKKRVKKKLVLNELHLQADCEKLSNNFCSVITSIRKERNWLLWDKQHWLN